MLLGRFQTVRVVAIPSGRIVSVDVVSTPEFSPHDVAHAGCLVVGKGPLDLDDPASIELGALMGSEHARVCLVFFRRSPDFVAGRNEVYGNPPVLTQNECT